MTEEKMPSLKKPSVDTLILVLGALAAICLLGSITISLRGDHPSADALLDVCWAIVGYLGGLLTRASRA